MGQWPVEGVKLRTDTVRGRKHAGEGAKRMREPPERVRNNHRE